MHNSSGHRFCLIHPPRKIIYNDQSVAFRRASAPATRAAAPDLPQRIRAARRDNGSLSVLRLWQTPLTMQHASRDRSQQCDSAVFMIERASFSFTEETAASNAMQHSRDAEAGAAEVMATARAGLQQLRLAPALVSDG